MTDAAGFADAGRLLKMIGASWMSQAVCVTAELRIADLLANGSKNVDDLARTAQCHQASLHRLMRALASLGLCTEQEDGFFNLTPMGSLLRTDAHPSVRSWVIWWGKYQWPAWGNLRHSVRTGESAHKLVTGHEGYERFSADPEAASVFDRAMAELTQLVAGEVVRVYDFSGTRRLVDVGGGYGELLSVILWAYPAMHGVLFDLPHTVDGAKTRLAKAGIMHRCQLVTGSFFDSVPGGGDLYLLKSVLHNWADDQSTVILGNCRRAMSKGAKLVLIERVMPARMKRSVADRTVARTDLNMLVGLGGRERTKAEFVALFASSGFKLTRFLPSTLEFRVIEAVPE